MRQSSAYEEMIQLVASPMTETLKAELEWSLSERLTTVTTALSTATITVAPTAYTQNESLEVLVLSTPLIIESELLSLGN
jgi:hypothetical protein